MHRMMPFEDPHHPHQAPPASHPHLAHQHSHTNSPVMMPTMPYPYQYHHQPPPPPPHHHHHLPVVQYASSPSTGACMMNAPPSLKRKAEEISPRVHATSVEGKTCQVCHFPDPILYAPTCGHMFHSRCVNAWPMEKCPVCEEQVSKLAILEADMNKQIHPRSGKWTKQEEKFVEYILAEFDRNTFPLANGTPVRLVLAKLLNCSTMRLSKKFQKNALGKRTFRIPKTSTKEGGCKMHVDRGTHTNSQKDFSYYENAFRTELQDQYRRENNSEEGALAEVTNLRHAVTQFWISNFLKFAIVIGQPVQGLDVSDSRKKKQALQKIRDGFIGELLQWSNSSSLHTPTMSPYSLNSRWESSYAMYPNSWQLNAAPEEHLHKKVKILENPSNLEISCDPLLGRFDLQPIGLNEYNKSNQQHTNNGYLPPPHHQMEKFQHVYHPIKEDASSIASGSFHAFRPTAYPSHPVNSNEPLHHQYSHNVLNSEPLAINSGVPCTLEQFLAEMPITPSGTNLDDSSLPVWPTIETV